MNYYGDPVREEQMEGMGAVAWMVASLLVFGVIVVVIAVRCYV